MSRYNFFAKFKKELNQVFEATLNSPFLFQRGKYVVKNAEKRARNDLRTKKKPFQVFCLKRQCHDDFAVFWPNLLKYLTKNLFCDMKLFLQHWKEIIKDFHPGRTNHNRVLATSLK